MNLAYNYDFLIAVMEVDDSPCHLTPALGI
jgi:hypothetical protein